MFCLVPIFVLTQQAQQPPDPYEALAKKLRSLAGKWDTVEKGALHDIKGAWDARPALDDALVLEYASTDNKCLLVFGLTGTKDAKGTVTAHVVVHMTSGAAVFTDFYGDVQDDTLTAMTKDKRQQMTLQWKGDEAAWVRSFVEKGKARPFITVHATRAKP